MMRSAPQHACPYGCGAATITVRNPRRNHTAWLDAAPVRFRATGGIGAEAGVKVPAVVVFGGRQNEREGDRLVDRGALVVDPAWVTPDGDQIGHTIHRFTCPNWPAVEAKAPIRRFNQEKK